MTQELKPLELAVVIQHQEVAQCEALYLSKDESTELLQIIGKNLSSHYPQIIQSGMIGIGSTYHLNQIIRPNFPIYTQLFELAKIRFRPNNFKPNIIGIGTLDEQFEISIFNKELSEFAEVLQVLPFSIILPDTPETTDFYLNLEENLITQLHLDDQLKKEISERFQIMVENVSIVTLSDLNGLFASQLIQIGLEELWQIMQAVIFNLDETLVTLGSGHILYWKLDEVAIITAHQSIFDDAMNDYKQSYQTYNTTSKRLETLFKSHRIPYSKNDVMNDSFFNHPITIESVRNQLSNQIKAL